MERYTIQTVKHHTVEKENLEIMPEQIVRERPAAGFAQAIDVRRQEIALLSVEGVLHLYSAHIIDGSGRRF